jgi:hypothetical protein
VLALLAVSIVLSVVLAEILVRVFLPQNLLLIRGDVWIPHERYAWTTAPNVDVAMSFGESPIRFVTDSDGNRTGPEGPRDGELRVHASNAHSSAQLSDAKRPRTRRGHRRGLVPDQ